MIKIFRKFRQQLLSDNKFNTYIFYALGEIILVVIGILIALQIDNWNSNRIDSHKESVYLERLQKEISEELTELEYLVKFQDSTIATADFLLQQFKQQKDFSKIEAFDKKLSFLMYSNSFPVVNTTFKELNTTGQLNLIKESNILTELVAFYQNLETTQLLVDGNSDVFYANVFPVFLEILNLEVENFVEPELELANNYHTPEIKDYVELKLSLPEVQRNLLNAISLVIMIHESNKSSTNVIITEGKDLLKLINTENNNNNNNPVPN